LVPTSIQVLAGGLGLSLSSGVVIADGHPDSPRDRAGRKRRDLILSVNPQNLQTAPQFENDI
jgi:S1-C subfamily serine protease